MTPLAISPTPRWTSNCRLLPAAPPPPPPPFLLTAPARRSPALQPLQRRSSMTLPPLPCLANPPPNLAIAAAAAAAAAAALAPPGGGCSRRWVLPPPTVLCSRCETASGSSPSINRRRRPSCRALGPAPFRWTRTLSSARTSSTAKACPRPWMPPGLLATPASPPRTLQSAPPTSLPVPPAQSSRRWRAPPPSAPPPGRESEPSGGLARQRLPSFARGRWQSWSERQSWPWPALIGCSASLWARRRPRLPGTEPGPLAALLPLLLLLDRWLDWRDHQVCQAACRSRESRVARTSGRASLTLQALLAVSRLASAPWALVEPRWRHPRASSTGG
mmetsp:Transcript_11278/g.43519  ORF Transcript_11278/g.43519 Transcript_11278/m.43519 type:complete len:332 (-) Transcript_11278:1326-2321(-)